MTAWSKMGANFLRDPSDPYIGDWSVGQGPDAPDRVYLRSILTELEPCTLLDVGCGTGIELDGILAEGLKVEYFGMDVTLSFIRGAKSRYPDQIWICRDVFNLGPDKGWNVVSSRAMLEHLEDGYTALQRLWGACSQVCVVSWFIPPEVQDDRVELTPDGFIHHYYNRDDMLDAVSGLPGMRELIIAHHENGPQKWESWVMRR